MSTNNSFYTGAELKSIGFGSYGENVMISRKASFYDPGKISIGNNVRIDDFCILSGQVKLGSFIHISAYSALYGRFGIEMEDFSGVSARSTLYSAMDDFSGEHMIGPLVPGDCIQLSTGKIVLEKYVQIGALSVVMPGVRLREGAVAGAMSLVNTDLCEWTINVGIPARFLKPRSRHILDIVKNI